MSALEPANSNEYLDVHSRRRSKSTHLAILSPYSRGNGSMFMPTDALAIHEIYEDIGIGIPGLDWDKRGIDDNGNPIPTRPFITTPNMDYLPNFALAKESVIARQDGRFFTSDFTILPQFHFKETYYMPFVPRKPPPDELILHPYQDAWYDLRRRDFVPEPGSLNGEVGRISTSLHTRFTIICKELRMKAEKLLDSCKFSSTEVRELKFSVRGMHLACVALVCGPQTWNLTLLSVTTFQRHFLSALACYRYLTVWKERRESMLGTPLPVDKTIMGALTVHLEELIEFYYMGVPVWYICPPSAIGPHINIVANFPLTLPPNIVRPGMEGAKVVYCGPASPIRNFACQSLRLMNIGLGHSALIVNGLLLPPVFRPPRPPAQPMYEPGYAHPDPPASPPSQNVSLPSTSTSCSPPVVLSTSASTSSSSAPLVSSTSAPQPPSLSMASSSNPLSGPPAKRQPARQVNLEKFTEPTGSFMPKVLDLWLSALQGVDKNVDLCVQHPDMELLRGYPFMDPFLLASGNASDKRFLLYLLAWLCIRPSWLNATTSREPGDSNFPRPQDWKCFLSDMVAVALGLHDLSELRNVSLSAPPPICRSSSSQPSSSRPPSSRPSSSRPSSSRPSSSRPSSSSSALFIQGLGSVPTNPIRGNKRATMLASVAKKFEILDLSNVTGPRDIFWNGLLLAAAEDLRQGKLNLGTSVIRQIVWDLFETNFRLELLALDRCLVSRVDMTVQETADRDALLLDCFPDQCLINANFSRSPTGLGAQDYGDRVDYVESFRKLVSLWPGPVAAQLANMKAYHSSGPYVEGGPVVKQYLPQMCLAVERVLYPFYCQTFFNYFGRAPTIPHTWPLSGGV